MNTSFSNPTDNSPLPGIVALAPMSGVTDLPFRKLSLNVGCDWVVTEMVASELTGNHLSYNPITPNIKGKFSER